MKSKELQKKLENVFHGYNTKEDATGTTTVDLSMMDSIEEVVQNNGNDNTEDLVNEMTREPNSGSLSNSNTNINNEASGRTETDAATSDVTDINPNDPKNILTMLVKGEDVFQYMYNSELVTNLSGMSETRNVLKNKYYSFTTLVAGDHYNEETLTYTSLKRDNGENPPLSGRTMYDRMKLALQNIERALRMCEKYLGGAKTYKPEYLPAGTTYDDLCNYILREVTGNPDPNKPFVGYFTFLLFTQYSENEESRLPLFNPDQVDGLSRIKGRKSKMLRTSSNSDPTNKDIVSSSLPQLPPAQPIQAQAINGTTASVTAPQEETPGTGTTGPSLTGVYAINKTIFEKQMLELNQRLLDSIGSGDYNTYRTLCHPKMTCIEGESKGHIVKGLEFHKYYFDFYGEPNTAVTINVISPHIRVIGENQCAILSYTRLDQKIINNFAQTQICQETRIWESIGGNMLLVHCHRSNWS